MPCLSARIVRSLNGQCILLLPPLVTSANSREVSVFSIFLLIRVPLQSSLARSVHLRDGGIDVHLGDGRLHGNPPLMLWSPSADNRWLTMTVPTLRWRRGHAYPTNLDI
jgi:hypothetical protein